MAISFVSDCSTEKGEECVFPFNYKGQVYNGCTRLDHKEKKLWCSTKNKADGSYETWGDCRPSCGEGMFHPSSQVFKHLSFRCR